MSSAGQLFGSIIGFGIGSIFGFGIGGAALGGMIGLWIDPADPPDPPPLGDLGCNSYVRNMPVPIVYGTAKVYGGIIWIGNNRVEMENDGSSKQPQYSAVYYADFACAVSEGIIASFEHYYINDNLLEDLKEEDKIYLDFYQQYGTASQTIDPIVSENLGADAVPWRHTALVVVSGKIGKSNQLPTFASEIKGLQCESDGQANPIKVVYDFMTNTRYGLGLATTLFDGSPTTSGSWKTASDYCDVLVYDGLGSYEARFRYSMVFDNRVKAYDLIKDILQTCRGFIYYAEGLLKVTIANASESPIFYFSESHAESFTTLVGCTTSRIYADFSAYPNDYWKGDVVSISLPGVGGGGYRDEYGTILVQTDTYIDTYETFSSSPSDGESFTIRKDNIVKDSFSYSRKATSDKANRYRTEFINKDDKYRTDFVEEDNVYDINITDEIREQTVTCNGIKRKSQAARINSFFLDFNSYTDYICDFQTDIAGYLLSVGDIIGITCFIPGWSAKLFRVIGLEESEDYTVKVNCLEYIPSVFHDSSTPITETEDFSIPNPYTAPANSTRFKVFEDTQSKKLFLCFDRPDNEPNWVGNLVYLDRGDGNGYIYIDNAYIITPSVKLFSDVNIDDTVINYDPDTMYDSFAASGSFWIEEEEIAYTSIDDVNNQFLGCTRGYNSTTESFHSSSEYCNLRKTTTPPYLYTDDEVGGSFTFKIISINVYDIQADSATALTDTIEIYGRYYAPAPVSGLQINGQGSDHTLAVSTDCLISWDLVTDGAKGYGVQYGNGCGYGGGEVEGSVGYRVRIYKTSDPTTILRTEDIGDITTTEYNYTIALNESDNGGVFEENLTIKVYQVNESSIYSAASILVTND